MSLTYTPASDRDVRYIARSNAALRTGHLLLVWTSLIAMFVIAFAYWGRRSASDFSRSSEPAVQVTNLNAVSDPKELTPVFEHLFANPADRQSAAQRSFEFIDSVRKARHSLQI